MKLNHDQRRMIKRKGRRSPWARAEQELRRRPWLFRDRCLIDALKSCFNGSKPARIYAGDVKLAKLAKCAPISIWRAKQDLERLHILHVTHTRGGFTRNPKGELVRAATGYEPHPDLYTPERVRAETGYAPEARPVQSSPAPASREEYMRRLEAAGARAGP